MDELPVGGEDDVHRMGDVVPLLQQRTGVLGGASSSGAAVLLHLVAEVGVTVAVDRLEGRQEEHVLHQVLHGGPLDGAQLSRLPLQAL